MTQIHRIAGLRISRIQGSELLPDLAPPEERLQREKSRIFSSDTIALTQGSAIEDEFDPSRREEHRDLVARLTVYAMNLIIMVFSLPLGIAIFLMNVLGGENLRTTAHVMALMGLFMALSANSGI